jgi:hypothetical protein
LAKQVERIPSGFVSVHSKAVPLGRVHLPGAGAANHLFRVALSNHDHLIGRKLDVAIRAKIFARRIWQLCE